MGYFTAVLVGEGGDGAPRGWTAVGADLEEVDDVDALADVVTDAAAASTSAPGSVLVVLEREDAFFALAREVDGDLALFVSDADAAEDSRYADALQDAVPAPVPTADPAALGAGSAGSAGSAGGDGEERSGAPRASWAGRPALLEDLGVSAAELVRVTESHDTASALTVLGEAAGFAELLEELR